MSPREWLYKLGTGTKLTPPPGASSRKCPIQCLCPNTDFTDLLLYLHCFSFNVLFRLTEGQVTVAKVLVGTIFLAGLLFLLLNYTGVLAQLSRNPDVAELIAAIENKIPKEARSLENLAGLAEMAFNSIDKYAKMNNE